MRRAATTATTLVAASLAAVAALGGCSGTGDQQILRPVAVAAGVEVDNPMRGQYVWDPVTRWSSSAVPLPFPQGSANARTRTAQAWPAVSTYYTRVAWSDLETDTGAFPQDTVLERRIAAAAARGQRTIFRVVMADPDTYSATDRPLYPASVAAGQWRARVDDRRSMFVPDWNSPAYVQGVVRLVTELGRRYDADPRVAGFDISGYGTWGEWNDQVWGPQLPPGRARISTASMRSIVDATLAAFSTTQLFALTDPELMGYALDRSPTVGLRMDCLGQWSGGGAWERILAVPQAVTRWRTAPVATEYCPSNYGTEQAGAILGRLPFVRDDVTGDLFANAVRQVMRWHVALVSSGNHPGAGEGVAMSARQVEDYERAARLAGYRYRVESVALPASMSSGDRVRVRSTWSNAGVAPLYGGPAVELMLRPHAGGAVVARTSSTVDLSSLVDDGTTGQVARVAADDELDLHDVAPGRYDVVVQVRAALSGVTSVVALAQQGRDTDGGYVLGSIDVH